MTLSALIVDPDVFSARLLANALERSGWLPRVAISAEHALQILQCEHPSVVLLELVLPHMSGLVFAERLSASAELRSIPIVCVTTVGGPAVQYLATEAGCIGYLQKPLEMATASERVLQLVAANRINQRANRTSSLPPLMRPRVATR